MRKPPLLHEAASAAVPSEHLVVHDFGTANELLPVLELAPLHEAAPTSPPSERELLRGELLSLALPRWTPNSLQVQQVQQASSRWAWSRCSACKWGRLGFSAAIDRHRLCGRSGGSARLSPRHHPGKLLDKSRSSYGHWHFLPRPAGMSCGRCGRPSSLQSGSGTRLANCLGRKTTDVQTQHGRCHDFGVCRSHPFQPHLSS